MQKSISSTPNQQEIQDLYLFANHISDFWKKGTLAEVINTIGLKPESKKSAAITVISIVLNAFHNAPMLLENYHVRELVQAGEITRADQLAWLVNNAEHSAVNRQVYS